MSFWWRLISQKLWQLIIQTSVLMVIFGGNYQVLAAEEVIFTAGAASQSVTMQELEQFALTGEMSPSLRFLFDYSKQDPQLVRSILTQQLPVDTVLVSEVLNTSPGEFALGKTSHLLHTKSNRANVESLRSALITSAREDRQISLLELLQNYPTRQVYVDSQSLGNTVRTIRNVTNWGNGDRLEDQQPLHLLDKLLDNL